MTNPFFKNKTRFKALSTGKRARGEMNRTERQFFEFIKSNYDYLSIKFELWRFALSRPEKGVGAFYTPDFIVCMSDRTFHVFEVKGTGPDDRASIVRLKCAAEQNPELYFHLAKKLTKKQAVEEGVDWKITTV